MRWWLLVIDVPDERSPSRRTAPDHIHATFRTEEQAETLKMRLETFGGHHRIVDLATTGGRCPDCLVDLIKW